jgi:hypothetical protein
VSSLPWSPSTLITRLKPCPDIPNIRSAYHLYVCPSLCMFIFICLSFCQPVLLIVLISFCASTLITRPKPCPDILNIRSAYHLYVCPSVYFVCLFFCLSVSLCVQFAKESVHFDHETKTLPGHPKHQVSIPSVCASNFACLSVYIISLFIHLYFVCLSFCLSVPLCIYLSVCPFTFLGDIRMEKSYNVLPIK